MQFRRFRRAWWLVLPTAIFAVLCSQAATAEQPANNSWSTILEAPAVCFAPGTDFEIVEQTYARGAEYHLANSLSVPVSTKFQIADWWTHTASDGGGISQGDPITLTWNVVPDGTNIPGDAWVGDSTAPSNLRAFLAGFYGSESTWLALLQQVFDRWESLTGITYVYEPNDDGGSWTGAAGQVGVRGDIRISGHAIDGHYGILAYNYYPDTGDMVIDTADDFYFDTSSSSRKLRNVVAHEHGHGLGLAHSCPMDQTKLMEPMLTTAFDGPQHDDILATNRSYGDRFEHNETAGAAEAFGAIGSLTASNLSVDDNTDADFYSLSVDPGAELDLSLTPVGATYLSGPQNGDGSCSSGTNYNSLTIQDLAVRVLASNGSTQLASADSNGVGGSETLSTVSLTAGGTYYVEVTGDASDAAQLYELSLTVSPSDQVFTDGFESSTTTQWTSTVQ